MKVKISVLTIVLIGAGYFFLKPLFMKDIDYIRERIEYGIQNTNKSGVDGDFNIALKSERFSNIFENEIFYKLINTKDLLKRYDVEFLRDNFEGSIDKNGLKSIFFYAYRELQKLDIDYEVKDYKIENDKAEVKVLFKTTLILHEIHGNETLLVKLHLNRTEKGWFINFIEYNGK
ncbi:MAG: hypothetical protein JXR48_04030 [Candidatus Delongbacteria bacterium]|nr:hypothetical protein [Candidatus Delongbacteria bacterium]MBN2834114.1 hypothetical protein [Candidatus Delongbacteria bacterium]